MPQEAPEQQMSSSQPSRALSKGLILRILIVSLALLIIVLLALRYWPKQSTTENGVNNSTTNSSANTNALSLRSGADQNPDETDTDGDGLTDAEEAELGTDPTRVDTDSDFLFDREEVEVYQTDPLVADTDRDGFLDGEEVKDRFNPNGPGSLLDFQNSRANLNVNQ
ncbi:MAG: hypothetical protein H6760_03770 [Candidatus Nomurabacteria bacterium]|nr:MAG: hypothetical protein H6760_03770 [Candidatus Nomurabacteria bacterium]